VPLQSSISVPGELQTDTVLQPQSHRLYTTNEQINILSSGKAFALACPEGQNSNAMYWAAATKVVRKPCSFFKESTDEFALKEYRRGTAIVDLQPNALQQAFTIATATRPRAVMRNRGPITSVLTRRCGKVFEALDGSPHNPLTTPTDNRSTVLYSLRLQRARGEDQMTVQASAVDFGHHRSESNFRRNHGLAAVSRTAGVSRPGRIKHHKLQHHRLPRQARLFVVAHVRRQRSPVAQGLPRWQTDRQADACKRIYGQPPSRQHVKPSHRDVNYPGSIGEQRLSDILKDDPGDSRRSIDLQKKLPNFHNPQK